MASTQGGTYAVPATTRVHLDRLAEEALYDTLIGCSVCGLTGNSCCRED